MREYFRGVRQEFGKITWPTRRETFATTMMVLLMVVVMAIFFLIVDEIASYGVQLLLG